MAYLSSVEMAFKNVGRRFGISEFKPLQMLCLQTLVSGQDVFACLPTSFGKSLIYQTWASLADELARDLPPLSRLAVPGAEGVPQKAMSLSVMDQTIPGITLHCWLI